MTSSDASRSAGATRIEAVETAETVEREIELDASAEEVWAALCEPDTWLADEGALDVSVGGTGVLVEDGVVRRAIVESVEIGRRLVYRWWNDGDDAAASRVELTILPSDGPTRLIVRETLPGSVTAGASAAEPEPDRRPATAMQWDLRVTCLALGALGSLPCRSLVTV